MDYCYAINDYQFQMHYGTIIPQQSVIGFYTIDPASLPENLARYLFPLKWWIVRISLGLSGKVKHKRKQLPSLTYYVRHVDRNPLWASWWQKTLTQEVKNES